MGRPREHDERTRERLLEAAGAIIDDGGAHELTVRRLAEAAGVTTRAIYSLFGGMPGVLSELFRIGAEDMAERHEAVPRQDDAAQEILPLALAYRAGALAHPDSFLLSFGRTGLRFEAADEVVAILWRCYARVLDAVQRALDQRGLGDRDAQQTTLGLWATVHGHASLELLGMLGPRAAAEEVWRDTIERLVAATFPGAPLALSRASSPGPSRRRPASGPRAGRRG